MFFSTARTRWIIVASAIAGAMLLAVFYSLISWTDRINDLAGDSTIYVLTAQYFAPNVAVDEASRFFAQTSQYPPLYPLLIALTGGAVNLLIAHLLTAWLALGAVGLAWWWLRGEGLGRGVTLLACTALALMPGLLLHVHYLLTETLFMFFTVGAIGLVCRAEAESRPRLLFVAAVCLAAAMLTRSAGVASAGALAIYLLLRRPKGAWQALCIAVLPYGVWSLTAGKGKASYVDIAREHLARVGEIDWLSYLGSQIGAYWQGLTVNLVGAGQNAVAGLLALLCLAAAVTRALQRKFDGLLVLAAIAMLILWPYPSERVRFMLPLGFVMMAQVVIVAHGLHGARFLRALPVLACGLFILTLTPNTLLMAARLAEPMPVELEAMRRTSTWYESWSYEERIRRVSFQMQVEEAMRQIPAFVEPGQCLFSPKPQLVAYYGHRKSIPLKPAPLGETRLQVYVSEECRYAYFWPYILNSYPEPFYPLRLVAEQVTPLYAPRELPLRPDSSNVGVLVRLGRDPATSTRIQMAPQ